MPQDTERQAEVQTRLGEEAEDTKLAFWKGICLRQPGMRRSRHWAGTQHRLVCETGDSSTACSPKLPQWPDAPAGEGTQWPCLRRWQALSSPRLPRVTKLCIQSSLTQAPSYTQNGILHMLDRNKRIKPRPERFQNCKDPFDLIITCEERVYDLVVEDLNSREQETCQPVHVINVDIQDNHEEATLGAFLICELCQCIQHTEDVDNEIEELLQEFEEKSGQTFLHTVCFY